MSQEPTISVSAFVFSVRSRALSALATIASGNLGEDLPRVVHLTIQEQVSSGESGGWAEPGVGLVGGASE